MPRPTPSDPSINLPTSPFTTPPSGLPQPTQGLTPYGPPGWTGGPAPVPKPAPTLGGLLHALKRRWVLATFLGGVVAGLVAAAIWFALPAGKHQARALVDVKSRTSDLVGRSGEDFEAFRRNQLFILRTRDLITRTLAEPAVASLETIRSADDPVRMLEEGVKVDVVAPEILAVSMTGDHAEDLRTIINTLVKKYIDDAAADEITTRDGEIKKLERLADEFKREIEAHEKAMRLLAEANQASGSEATDAKVARMQQELAKMDAEVFARKKEVQELTVRIDLLKKKLAAKRFDLNPVELGQFVDADPRVAVLLKQKLEKEMLRNREVERAADQNAPTIKELNAQIERLETQLAAARKAALPEVEAVLKTASERQVRNLLAEQEEKLLATARFLADWQKTRDEFEQRISTSARAGVDLDSLQKGLAPKREYLNKIESQLIQLRIAKNLDPRVKVRESAVAIVNQNLQRKILFASMGGMAAFLGVLALVGFLEWRTRRVDGVDQVVNELGLRIIGTVPAFPSKASLKAAEAAGTANWRFVLNESINSARTMLLHTARNQSMQVVMVTSATQGEGKTSLASQLATSMATAGMRTLLVDCDLRNPSVHKLFDLGPAAGVSEVLRQEADVSEAVHPTTVPNLWVIPAGQCSAGVITALAQGHPLETLFNRLRGQFDFIIVDSCPVLPVADALLVGQHVDGVVFSIMQDVSQLPKLLIASEKLAQLNIPLVGAVVNGIRSGDMYSYGYNYVKQLPA
jgi:succinoglycan biosynthesis transport protein ExoP